jgi:hypothetical protein
MEVTRIAYFKNGMSQQDAVDLGCTLLLEEYGTTYAEQNYPDTVKTPEKMAEVFSAMFKENPLDQTTTIPFEMADGTLSVEQNFSVELPFTHPETGKPLMLQGTLDMLGMRDGIIYAEDEKTCKSVLADHDLQADLLRTQKEVAYVVLANKNKERFGGQEVTHIRINRCKIKKNYTKTEHKVETYEFVVDAWFQTTWWSNLLYQVADMLHKYAKFVENETFKRFLDSRPTEEKPIHPDLVNKVIFPRAYGTACTLFFRPCVFTYHCTSGNAQDLQAEGFKQVMCDTVTKGRANSLHDYRKFLFEEVPVPIPVEVESDFNPEFME